MRLPGRSLRRLELGQALHQPQQVGDQARLIARRLAATGKPVSRRALRSAGVKGSNESLSALARTPMPNY